MIEHALAVVRRQSLHMARLLDDLLDISRITRGKIELQIEALDFDRAIANAVEMSRPLIDAHKHRLTVHVAERLRVRGDAARLAQILSNLLNNAAKYMEPGGRITLTAERNGLDIV
jgi:signal transduction histidine kinase